MMAYNTKKVVPLTRAPLRQTKVQQPDVIMRVIACQHHDVSCADVQMSCVSPKMEVGQGLHSMVMSPENHTYHANKQLTPTSNSWTAM